MPGNIAAIVLAAGLSSRMEGGFKPLLPLGESTVLERAVTLFQCSGVTDVRVVSGHRLEELLPVVTSLGCRLVANPAYLDGMFSSVTAGIAALGSNVTAFFVLPADLPLVRPTTINRLLTAAKNSTASVIYPVFMGMRGHPPLIAGRLSSELIAWQGKGGLQGALANHERDALEVEVADEMILRDMDTPDDYAVLQERVKRLQVPTDLECQALLERVLRVDDKIIRHSLAVARLATALGEELNRVGYPIDLPLLRAAALLHDLLRHESDHARAGARLLGELGYEAIAELVASHMDLVFNSHEPITAAAVLFLADKLIQGEKLVSLTDRFGPALEKHISQPETLVKVHRRLMTAQTIQQQFECLTGCQLTAIATHLASSSNHVG
jgi:molybdenum cofactor cytidylyltransferase